VTYALSRRGAAVGPADPPPPVSSTDPDERSDARLSPAASLRVPVLVSTVILMIALLMGIALGPVNIPLGDVIGSLLARIPLLHFHTQASHVDQAIVWQLRMPRVVLAGLVGCMLASGGAGYQGVFRNPLADPYLLGVAAGAGLGATVVIVSGGNTSEALPIAAFAGGILAVTMTYVVGAAGGTKTSGRSIVLAGVAVAALLTAIQTYLQQQNSQEIQQIYNWILGSLSVATWSQVILILPYVIISALVMLGHRRILDVFRIGEDETGALGIHPERTRLIIVGAATLGTAAAVSVSGLIGFVGIIVPHTVRLTTSASYRVVLPVSMIGGAAFLVLADLLARTLEAPAEIPIGVITACVGAPFFLFVLMSRRAQRRVSDA
jgi:iron complex transport system permease protein